MPALSPCPGPKYLTGYVEGRLGLPAHEMVEAHLEECRECQRRVEELDAHTPTPFAPLKADSTTGLEGEAVLGALVEQVVALGGPSLTQNPAVPVPGEGHVLGGYVLREPLGAGGMGRVFRAFHQRMKREVALKVVSPELVRSPAARARFAREVEALARLRSPHIVTAYDAGTDQGVDYLVLEYIEGTDLARLVKEKGPLSIPQALDCVRQAARGLAAAHAAKLVHRDVKPANLLLDAQGTVKLLDLGLARPEEEGADLTRTGQLLGTAAYMAPEQALGQPVDARADLYSLGCTLFYLLTGRPPYEGPNPLAILLAHRQGPIPALADSVPDCPQAVERIYQRLMARRPEDRYPHAQALLADLDALDRPIPAVPPQRRGLRVLAGAVCVWAALLVGLLALWPGQRQQPAVPGRQLGEAASAHPPRSQPEREAVKGVVRKKDIGPPPTLELLPAPKERQEVLPLPAPVSPRTPAIEMVRIEPGDFLRGSPEKSVAPASEKPQKRIRISRPFLLGKFELTQGQYREVMGHLPAGTREEPDRGDYPVEALSWLDAVCFCNALSERQGLKPYYRIEGRDVSVAGGTGYRLPTEAEWEYAARAGSTTLWSFGDDEKKLAEYAWFADNSDLRPHPVGTKKPNAWGLFDMHGNVPEWTWDRYARDYYKRSPVVDPAGPGEGEQRVYRGGSFGHEAAQLRSAARDNLGMHYGFLTRVGMRLARDAQR